MAVDREMGVLVADDEPDMRKLLREFLSQLNFGYIVEAGDGQEAFDILMTGRERISLVISDWDMTPMNGIHLLREIRGDDGLRHLPFILVTAEAGPDKERMAREAGASGYILKPFDKSVLEAGISAALGTD